MRIAPVVLLGCWFLTTSVLANEPPSMNDVVQAIASFNAKIGSARIETETTVSIVEERTGDVKSVSPKSKLSAWFDGVRPVKYRLTYRPSVMPHFGRGDPFVILNKTIASDGRVCVALTEPAAGQRAASPKADIVSYPGRPGVDFDYVQTTLAFTLPGAFRGLSVESPVTKSALPERLNDEGNGLLSFDFDPAFESKSLGNGKTEVHGSTRRIFVVVDSTRGFSLQRLEHWRVDINTAKKKEVVDRYYVDDCEKDTKTGVFWPSRMHYESFLGDNPVKMQISVLALQVGAPPPPEGFTIKLPAGAHVSDARLGISREVGKSPREVTEDIERSVDEEKKHRSP